MKNTKKKQTLSDRFEASIRRDYYPAILARFLGDLLDIENHALWLATEEGREVEGYMPEEAQAIVEKQAQQGARLKKKIAFIKKTIDTVYKKNQPKHVHTGATNTEVPQPAKKKSKKT